MRFLNIILVALVGSLLAPGCTPPGSTSTLDIILKRKVMIIGVKSDSPPFGVRDKDGFWGLDIDLARHICDKLGVTPKWVAVTTATRESKLLSGEVDLIAASMTITRDRERRVDFSREYFVTDQAFMVKKGSGIKGYSDLAAKFIGALKNSTAANNVKRVQPDAMVEPFDSYTQAMKALDSGKVKAITTDYMILVGLRSGKEDRYDIVGRFGYEPYGLAMRQNDSRFRDRINEILQELWDTGVLQRIYVDWFNEKGRYPAEVNFHMNTYPTGPLPKKKTP